MRENRLPAGAVPGTLPKESSPVVEMKESMKRTSKKPQKGHDRFKGFQV